MVPGLVSNFLNLLRPLLICGREGKQTSNEEDATGSHRAVDDPETLLFVDIDGVLNVAVREETEHPLSVSKQNLDRAKALISRGNIESATLSTCNRLLAICAHGLESQGEGSSSTYAEFCSGSELDVSETFVKRLAKLIQVSGPNRQAVLSSTWRQPKHSAKVAMLEKAISRCMNENFTFDAKTPLIEEKSASGRLAGIGKFIAEHSFYASMDPSKTRMLRVLVVDDFHCSPLNSWMCNGTRISSVEEAEKYLERFIPATTVPAIKLLHTYDEWTTTDGLLMQVGSGLTMKHLNRGLEFLKATGAQEARQSKVLEGAVGPVQHRIEEDEHPAFLSNGSTSFERLVTEGDVETLFERLVTEGSDSLNADLVGVDPFERLVTEL